MSQLIPNFQRPDSEDKVPDYFEYFSAQPNDGNSIDTAYTCGMEILPSLNTIVQHLKETKSTNSKFMGIDGVKVEIKITEFSEDGVKGSVILHGYRSDLRQIVLGNIGIWAEEIGFNLEDKLIADGEI